MKSQFERSQDWPLVANIINTFDQEKKYKYRVDWLEYLSHAKIEDFYKEEKGCVFVSTMHKIKGKQFDKVFLLLDKFLMDEDSKTRVVYVAITRPRDYLEIHTHLSTFDHIETLEMVREKGFTSDESLPVFSIQCSLSDVVLSHFHKQDIKSRTEFLVAGDWLEFSGGHNFHRAMLIERRNEMVVCFSRRFKETLDSFFEKGYKVKETKVGHIVYWWDEKSETKVRVVLPAVELIKHNFSSE